MIDKSFIQKIEAMAEPKTFKFHGCDFASKDLSLIEPPAASSFTVSTLAAVADYVDRCSAETRDNIIVHIVDPKTVSVFSALDDNVRSREFYITARTVVEEFPFGRKLELENFIIALQAQFEPTENIDAILKIVGNLSLETKLSVEDDGTTQRATAKTGIAKVENVSLPNPIALSPYRTFSELDQPSSNFVFRMSGDIGRGFQCALYEADGGRWKIEAIDRICKWLSEYLPDNCVILS